MCKVSITPNDLLVFDAVDTLFYPDPPVAEAYFRWGRHFGATQSKAELQARFPAAYADQFADEMTAPADHGETRRRWYRVVERLFPGVDDSGLLFDSLWEHFADAGNWSLFPEVKATISGLADRGVEFAIASNFDNRIQSVLRGFPCLGQAEQVVWSSQLGVAKPNPIFFERAATRFERPVDQLIMVGDSVSRDYEAPRAAGWRAILLDRSRLSPHCHVASLAALPGLVN